MFPKKYHLVDGLSNSIIISVKINITCCSLATVNIFNICDIYKIIY